MIEIEKAKKMIKTVKTNPAINKVLVDKEYLSYTNLEIALRIKTFKRNSLTFLFPLQNLDLIQDDIKLNLDTGKIIINDTFILNYNKNELENYPQIPTVDNAKFITAIKILYLKKILDIALPFTANDDRHILQNVLFKIEEFSFRIVASDGRRLANINIEQRTTSETTFAIHKDVLKAFKRILRLLDEDKYIAIYEAEKYIVFTYKDEIEFYCEKKEPEFPDWKSVYPQGESICSFAFYNLYFFSEFLKEILSLQKKNKEILPIQIDIPNEITYMSYHKIICFYEDIVNNIEVRKEFDIGIYSFNSDTPIHFHINPKYLLQAVKIGYERFFFYGTEEPLKIESKEVYTDTNIYYSFLIMPFRCNCPKSE